MAAVAMNADGAGEGTAGRVCLGVVTGAHGVQGAVRIKPFTAEPEAVGAYGRLTDEAGRCSYALTVIGVKKGVVLARLDGVDDRDAAEALRGLRLYVPRSALPQTEEEEYYHADLIGLRVELEDGREFGRVRALYDFGAGDVVEVLPSSGGQPVVLPFTREAVPVVDLDGGRIVISPPEGLLGEGLVPVGAPGEEEPR